MLQHLDEKDLFAHLRMLRSGDSRLFLVVEGETDIRSLDRCIDSNGCTLIAGYGKHAVIQALESIKGIDPTGCVGLVDRDFGGLLDENIPSNVFRTDLYDREADLLLLTGLLDDYVDVVSESEKLKELLTASGEQSVKSIVIRISACIGKIRWASVRDKLGVRLSDFPIGAVIEWPAIVKEQKVIDLAIQRTIKCSYSGAEIAMACLKPIPTKTDRICNGHDLIASLSASAKWWAKRHIGRQEIKDFISAAVRCDILVKLDWFHHLNTWANKNGRTLWNCDPEVGVTEVASGLVP